MFPPIVGARMFPPRVEEEEFGTTGPELWVSGGSTQTKRRMVKRRSSEKDFEGDKNEINEIDDDKLTKFGEHSVTKCC